MSVVSHATAHTYSVLSAPLQLEHYAVSTRTATVSSPLYYLSIHHLTVAMRLV
jgi:hypothetical protein